jgi:hypothetical protein
MVVAVIVEAAAGRNLIAFSDIMDNSCSMKYIFSTF